MSVSRNLSKGPIVGHFRALAVPMAIGMVFTTLYNVVDTYYAGMLSTEAQAGLAISFQVFFVLLAVGFGLNTAMNALVGKALGEERDGQAKRIAYQGITYAVVTSILLWIGGVIASPYLIGLISEPSGYQDAANDYLRWLMFAAPSFLIAFGANGILGAQGDMRSMQQAQIAAFFANLLLNPLFIFGVPGVWGGIGFNGIALSTIVSQTGVMIYILVKVFGSDVMTYAHEATFLPRWKWLRQITAQAIPVTFAMVVMMFAGFVVQFFLKDFGAAAAAAYGIGLRVEQLILLPGFGLTGALLPIISQNYGAKNYDRVREAVYFCAKAGVILMFSGSLVLWVAAPYAMAFFSDDAEVVRLGANYLRVDGFILPVYILLFAANSFLQGMQKPGWTVWIGIYRQGFGVAFFVYLLVRIFDWGTWGVWIGIAIAVTTGLVLTLFVVNHVARQKIGGLWRPGAVPEA